MKLKDNTPIICSLCKHRNGEGGLTCKAFPNGIPIGVVNGEVLHDKKLPNQDNDIIFEPNIVVK